MKGVERIWLDRGFPAPDQGTAFNPSPCSRLPVLIITFLPPQFISSPLLPLISTHSYHSILCIKPRSGFTEVCVFLDPLDQPPRSQSPIAGSQLRIPVHSV